MLTSQKVIDAINEQIGYEFSAELQYYAIGAHFATEALPQLSQHFFQQAEEEKGHALRFIKYIVDAGGRVVIPANKRVGGISAKTERLHHDQFLAVVPDRAAGGSLVDGQSAQDHRARGHG